MKAASIVDDCISLCESDLDFCMGPHTKKVHDNQFLLLKQQFLHPFVIFKSFLTLIMLYTDFLIHSKILWILIKIVARGRVAKLATFGVKWASDESFCPSTVITLQMAPLPLTAPNTMGMTGTETPVQQQPEGE